MRILQRERHAMQRPEWIAVLDRLVGRMRLLARAIGVERDDGVQRRIVLVDLRQMRVQHGGSRYSTLADRGGELAR